MDVAVVIVGDEILSGHVRDDNTHFIATRLAELGHRHVRASIVADDPDVIAKEIERAREERIELVLVCGGLGSTHDDRTMEGVAASLERPLEACSEILETIEGVIARAEEAGFSADSLGAHAMRKMALAPAGARVLRCSVPFIPAFAIDEEGFSIVVLPGPPNQLARVFTETVELRYLAGTGTPSHRIELTHQFPESTFAALLSDLTTRYPTTSIGSYPQADHTLVRVAGLLEEVEAIGRELREAIQAVEDSEEGKRFLRYLSSRRGSRP